MGNHSHPYHLVDPSPWPILGAISAFTMFLGAVFFMHDYQPAGIPLNYALMPIGFIMVLYTMRVWWRDVVREGKDEGHHNSIVQHGLRIGMALFIISEVMFFFAFFWSFFKAALDPVLLFDGPHLFDSSLIKTGIWPPDDVVTLDAWDLPLINTLILLLSGTTVTWAHYALLKGNKKDLVRGLALTIILGACFTSLQVIEYGHALFGFKDGIYSSNFYMATGFHGAHVLIGTLFLCVCLVRAIKNQFTPKGHLGFEFAAWYWHFVDVVWLFLFVFVYVWGA